MHNEPIIAPPPIDEAGPQEASPPSVLTFDIRSQPALNAALAGGDYMFHALRQKMSGVIRYKDNLFETCGDEECLCSFSSLSSPNSLYGFLLGPVTYFLDVHASYQIY